VNGLWQRVRLVGCVLLFGVGFAFLGAFTTLDSHLPLWWAMLVMGVFGVIIGAAFGGAKWRWLDLIFRKPDKPENEPGQP
jgi:hypothetical protein